MCVARGIANDLVVEFLSFVDRDLVYIPPIPLSVPKQAWGSLHAKGGGIAIRIVFDFP